MHKLKNPKVSIIIPTHNRAEMLQRAVKSVLLQTWKGGFEIIIVSDGSNDNTEDVVRLFNDSRIQFFKHNEARGASAARNTGMRAAKGEYIAFLDDDDEWTSNKLEIQMPVIENSGPEIGLVYAWMEYFIDGESHRVSTPKLRGNVFVEMLDKQAIGGCPTIIIKKKVIEKIGYFDETLPRGNDGDYWRRISKYYHVDFIPRVLAIINIGHPDRISVNSNKNLKDSIIGLEDRLQLFKDDFDKFPKQKASHMEVLATVYLQTAQYKKAVTYFLKIVRSQTTLRYKLKLFNKSLRTYASHQYKKAFHSIY